MPGYIKPSLQRFDHPIPTKIQDSPFPHTPPNYGDKLQYTKEPETTEIRNDKGNKFLQQFNRTLLHLSRSVYITLLTLLRAIASQK